MKEIASSQANVQLVFSLQSKHYFQGRKLWEANRVPISELRDLMRKCISQPYVGSREFFT